MGKATSDARGRRVMTLTRGWCVLRVRASCRSRRRRLEVGRDRAGEIAGLVAVDLDHDHVGLRAAQTHVDVTHLEHHRTTHRCLTRLGDGASGAESEQLQTVADGWITGSIHGADRPVLTGTQAAQRHDLRRLGRCVDRSDRRLEYLCDHRVLLLNEAGALPVMITIT